MVQILIWSGPFITKQVYTHMVMTIRVWSKYSYGPEHIQWFSRRKHLHAFAIWSYVKLTPHLAAILDDKSASKYKHLVSISFRTFMLWYYSI